MNPISVEGEVIASNVGVEVRIGPNTVLTWHKAQLRVPPGSVTIDNIGKSIEISLETRQLLVKPLPEPVEPPSLAFYRIQRVILAQEEWLREAVPLMKKAGYAFDDLCLARFMFEGVVALVPKEQEFLPLRLVLGHWPLFEGSKYMVSDLNADWREFARFDVPSTKKDLTE